MGDWTDWYLLGDEEVTRLALVDDPRCHWPHLGMSGITCFDLAALVEILYRSYYNPRPLYEHPDRGYLVLQIPHRLILDFASSNAAQLCDAAEIWRHSPGLVHRPVIEVRQILTRIRHFARDARRLRRRVLQRVRIVDDGLEAQASFEHLDGLDLRLTS